MQDIEKFSRQVMDSDKAGQLNDIANSADGKKIAGMVDAGKLEEAAKTGNTQAIQAILTQVLKTDEGKRLAKSISEVMDKK